MVVYLPWLIDLLDEWESTLFVDSIFFVKVSTRPSPPSRDFVVGPKLSRPMGSSEMGVKRTYRLGLFCGNKF